MKKTILVILAVLLMPAFAHAQFDGLIKKAANKVASKVSENVIEKKTDEKSDQLEQSAENSTESISSEEMTIEELMLSVPELPSVNDLVNHKDAELNERPLKLMTSKVTSFMANVLQLSGQVSLASYGNRDSAAVAEMAYNYAEASTGLSREELERLSEMSEEEQEAFMMAHYSSGRAEQAQLKAAEDISKLMEPLQPMIDKWEKVSGEVDEIYSEMLSKLRPIYDKYAGKLAKASEKELANVQLSYYTECAPKIRESVEQAMAIRLKKQLPIAQKIEEDMAKIREQHPSVYSQILNYPVLTATLYFGEVSKLLELPSYDD